MNRAEGPGQTLERPAWDFWSQMKLGLKLGSCYKVMAESEDRQGEWRLGRRWRRCWDEEAEAATSRSRRRTHSHLPLLPPPTSGRAGRGAGSNSTLIQSQIQSGSLRAVSCFFFLLFVLFRGKGKSVEEMLLHS